MRLAAHRHDTPLFIRGNISTANRGGSTVGIDTTPTPIPNPLRTRRSASINTTPSTTPTSTPTSSTGSLPSGQVMGGQSVGGLGGVPMPSWRRRVVYVPQGG